MAANLKEKEEEIWGIMSSKTFLMSLKCLDISERVCFEVLVVEVQEIKGLISKVARLCRD